MLRKALGALDSAVVLPPLRVESILRSLKVRALTIVAEDTMSICLVERKPKSGVSNLYKKKENEAYEIKNGYY